MFANVILALKRHIFKNVLELLFDKDKTKHSQHLLYSDQEYITTDKRKTICLKWEFFPPKTG